MKDGTGVHRGSEALFHTPCTEDSDQQYRGSRGRYNAPCDHVDRPSTTCAQEFNWLMASSVSTGGCLLFFLYRMLTSAKCIIWIVLAATAEVPVVVSLFLLLIA
jgi:hypothetical protein